jgi:hypothetical protein
MIGVLYYKKTSTLIFMALHAIWHTTATLVMNHIAMIIFFMCGVMWCIDAVGAL